MAYQDTTVVFVPGAWHTPNGYDPVIGFLHTAEYKTSKVWAPSVKRDGNKLVSSFDEDITEIRKHLKEATEAGQKVVLVMHSYGGVTGSQAVEGFDQATLASQGHKDGRGVIHLVYLAAFMLRKGESINSVQPGAGPADWIGPADDGAVAVINPAHVFYNDFESQEQIDHWVADLSPHSPGAFLNTVQHEPWRTIPTTFVACENDNAILISMQKGFLRNVIDAGAADLRTVYWKCGHTPHGAKPWETSLVIRAAAGDIERISTAIGLKSPVQTAVRAVGVEA